MTGLVNALEVARELDLKFFTPSSIGAFGPSTPKDNTPQDTIQRPTTMYGVTKALENCFVITIILNTALIHGASVFQG